MSAVAATAVATVPADQRAWSQTGETLVPMVHMTGDLDDLSNIFDIADFDLEAIPNVSAAQFADDIQHNPETHPTTSFLDNIPHPPHGTATHDFGEQDGFTLASEVDTQQYDGHDEQQGITNLDYAGNALYHQQLPQHFSPVHQSPYAIGIHQSFTSGGQIPPTPNSYEMHGEAGRFLQQHSQQLMFEQHEHLRKLEQQHQHQHQQHQHQQHTHMQHRQQHAQFTPMASPDGTPQYTIQSEFTTPGAYFSPLTSPALHAQLPSATARSLLQQAQGYYTNPSTAPNSNAPSPVDLNNEVEMTDGVNLAEPSKRTRRRLVAPRSVGPVGNRPRQSPIQKAQKRKSGLLTSIVPAKDLDQMLADGQSAGLVQPVDSSESGSISPEPLSEALMGPPPRPTTLSPSLNAQLQTPHTHNLVAYGGKAAAATPKSILSMRSNQYVDAAKGSPVAIATGHTSLEDLKLPEAASKRRPFLAKIDVAAADSATAAERSNNSRKTPKLGPSSTPSSLRPESASTSACASPLMSFSPSVSGSTPTGLLKDKKGDLKCARTVKKRSSVGGSISAVASPALRPRISPSIKPLLPEGSNLHSPTHALLLASKSNYQNLLEGNHLPGVNYPDSLSTGLTSKRTSHKVAEQGRRNRINEALKEMQSLIPSPSILAKQQHSDDASGSRDGGDGEDGSPDGGGTALDVDDGKESKESAAAKSNSSKAATVESANRYIRLLKESDASLKAAIFALQQENEEIRRRFAQATGTTLNQTEMSAIQEIDVNTPDGSSD